MERRPGMTPVQRLRALADEMEYKDPDLSDPTMATWVTEIRQCCNEVAASAADAIEKVRRIAGETQLAEPARQTAGEGEG